MLVQPYVLQRMAEEKEKEIKKYSFSVLTRLTRISSRKLTTKSMISHQIRNHGLDFRKAYRLCIAA